MRVDLWSVCGDEMKKVLSCVLIEKVVSDCGLYLMNERNEMKEIYVVGGW